MRKIKEEMVLSPPHLLVLDPGGPGPLEAIGEHKEEERPTVILMHFSSSPSCAQCNGPTYG